MKKYRSGAIRRTTKTKTRSRWRLGEHISLHESLRDRRAIQKPEAVTRHSEESQRRKTRTFITETVPLFPWVVEGTSFAWGLKNKNSAAICHSEKTPEKGIPTLIRHPPAKRTHRYWSTAAIGKGQRQQGLFFSWRKHDVMNTRTREGQE